MMRATRSLAAVGAAALTVALAACGSSGSSGGTSTAASGPASSAPAQSAALTVVKTSLGSVVAGPDGHTVYMFGKDTKGSTTSACTGSCLTIWPPVIVSGTPKASGISGKVGTIKTADGKLQATLGGWPLYYYTGDKGSGDASGQGNNGFGGVWRVLNASGSQVTAPASGGGSSSSSGGYNYGGSY